MSQNTVRKARFVTVCQQLLALGLILAALTPAANVVSLDVVTGPTGSPPRRRAVGVRGVRPRYEEGVAGP